MLTRLFGRFEIAELTPQDLDRIDADKIPAADRGFESEVGRQGHNFPAHSSTTWAIYAKDVADGSPNLVRFEPTYLEDSPPLVPDVGIVENVFPTSVDTVQNGSTLAYFGSYGENPFEWSERELQVETDRNIRSMAGLVDEMETIHFLEGLDMVELIQNEDVFCYVVYGVMNNTGNGGVFVLVSETDPLSLKEDSEVAQHWALENNRGPIPIPDTPSSHWDASTMCTGCGEETLHKRVNHRDRAGRYVDDVYQCTKCGERIRMDNSW